MAILSPLPQFLFLALRNVDCPLILMRDEHIVYATGAVSDLFGYTPRELIDMPAIHLAAPPERERLLAKMADRYAKQDNSALRYHANGQRKDGTLLANLTITILTYPQSHPPILQCVHFETMAYEDLYDFALQAADVIHQYNKAILSGTAINTVQPMLWGLEQRVEALEQQALARQYQRARWRQHGKKVLAVGGAGGALVSQELWTGFGGMLWDWARTWFMP